MCESRSKRTKTLFLEKHWYVKCMTKHETPKPIYEDKPKTWKSWNLVDMKPSSRKKI